MKTVTIDGKTYNVECKEDGQIVLTPAPKLPRPNKEGWYMDGCGDVCPDSGWVTNGDYNAFQFEDFAANQVAPSLRVFFAMWQVKEHVEPDFMPDWSDNKQEKHVIAWNGKKNEWCGDSWWYSHYNTPVFSTEEKVYKAIAILNHWGVRP